MDERRENEITGQKGGGKGRGHRDEREGGTSTTHRTHPKLPIWSNRNGTITVRSTIRGSDGVGVAFFTFLAFSRTLFSHDGFTKTDSELHCVHPFILIKI